MSVRNLASLFEPSSIAVVGASKDGAGAVLMRNLLTSGFDGPIMPVNPKYEAISGILAYPEIARLPTIPDLAIVCTPPHVAPQLIEELGELGTRAVVVLSGVERFEEDQGSDLHERLLRSTRKHGIRILGTSSLGFLKPRLGLNASVAPVDAIPGNVALVSQSGALTTAVLDWALEKGIGFSTVISLGCGIDVGFDDALDYLSADSNTKAILLCIESIEERRDFVAAARSAARSKPVVAIKIGHGDRQANKASREDSHAAMLASSDRVFDAVLRRAGILRVRHIEELFSAVETLDRGLKIRGDKLAVLTNGTSTAAIACDELLSLGLKPAPLPPDLVTELHGTSTHSSSWDGSIALSPNAPGSDYETSLNALMASSQVDTTVLIHVPTADVDSTDIARSVIAAAGRTRKRRLIISWVGGNAVHEARRLCAQAGIATYETPDRAVRAYWHLLNHRRNREILMQTPPSSGHSGAPKIEAARALIRQSMPAGAMTGGQAMTLLSTYGIPTVDFRIGATPETAAKEAEALGFPVALTIESPDIARLRDVGGIALWLDNPDATRDAAANMLARVRDRRPSARISGFAVRPMMSRPNARQLILGAATDPVFGPAIVAGEGGRAVELQSEHAIGLPPLNSPLARDLISHTRVWDLLQRSSARPEANIRAICDTLTQLSQLIVDHPEVIELEANPVLVDEHGVTITNAYVRLTSTPELGRLVIRPYPVELEEPGTLRNGRSVCLRPIRPEDELEHHAFLGRVSAEDLRFRFFTSVHDLEHALMARLTQIDYDREMAFIAVSGEPGTEEETLGEVRAVRDPDNDEAEFAVLVRSDLKRCGLGRLLMEKLIRYYRALGTANLVAEVLSENQSMLALAQRLGMQISGGSRQDSYRATLPLR